MAHKSFDKTGCIECSVDQSLRISMLKSLTRLFNKVVNICRCQFIPFAVGGPHGLTYFATDDSIIYASDHWALFNTCVYTLWYDFQLIRGIWNLYEEFMWKEAVLIIRPGKILGGKNRSVYISEIFIRKQQRNKIIFWWQ